MILGPARKPEDVEEDEKGRMPLLITSSPDAPPLTPLRPMYTRDALCSACRKSYIRTHGDGEHICVPCIVAMAEEAAKKESRRPGLLHRLCWRLKSRLSFFFRGSYGVPKRLPYRGD